MQEGGFGKEGCMEEQPPSVQGASAAKQGGEIRARWAWVEPCVWTDRMLKALEGGVKGGVWFSLMDKVCKRSNLEAAFTRVKGNRGGAGADHVSIPQFEAHLETELTRLEEALNGGEYAPQPVLRKWIPKGGGKMRPLGIPVVRDRVVQTALRNVLEPIFERRFAEHSYGFRPGRGTKDALRRVNHLLEAGYCHVVDADIKGYFDSIPKDALLARVREEVADGRVLELVSQYLNQSVMDSMKTWKPETGTPQGAVISPLLANIYLNPLDHLMASTGVEMVRYADDFVLLCRSAEEARAALEMARAWLEEAGLTLHPEKTRIVSLEVETNYFEFLGYRFKRHKGRIKRFPRKGSEVRFRDKVAARTRRCNGHSMERIIASINPILRGWFQYYKHTHYTVFLEMDGYVRMRLRSILRKRHKGKGRGRGADHWKWPNDYFTERGLFSLEMAYEQALQSSRR